MLAEDRYFLELPENEIWERYCGFLDLSIHEFMDIQRELLMDEVERVWESVLGRKIIGDVKPQSVEEFRELVPLTTYSDYEPYLSERREDVLTEKPYTWCHSSGRGGYYKWIPYTHEFMHKTSLKAIAALIMATCSRKGQVNLSPGFKMLLTLPPPPYVSGTLFTSFAEEITFTAIPPADTMQNSSFQERVQEGFRMALREDVDIIGAIASVLVKVGEQFSGQAQGMKISRKMLHPKILTRLARAWLRSKRAGRPMLPKDIWPTKGIATGGVDTYIYKDAITYYWGKPPHEFFVSTEAQYMAVQTWNRKGLVFFPDQLFFEFIPYEENESHRKEDKGYQPPTVLLDEVEEGKSYEVVITQLCGMPLLRYRTNDIIKVIGLRDEETGINLPHIVSQHRIGETINLGSLANLDEKTIWQAIANTGIEYTEWSACKEFDEDQSQSYLRIYLELKGKMDAEEVATLIHNQLEIVDTDYKDVMGYLEIQATRVTLLSPGTFQRYTDKKQAEGADLAHLKPSHMNPPDDIIQLLLELNDVTG
ncbi:MAG: GH3 auxin-responsive promoter family protein [Dehalococcoidales bacterium]|nr:GH3 auxin-responsive promoter family protein [Dehalococcoidales bacterium]